MTRRNDGANAKGAELPASVRPSYHHHRRDRNHRRRGGGGRAGRGGTPGPVAPLPGASSSNSSSSSPSTLLPHSSLRSTTFVSPNFLYSMPLRDFANNSLLMPLSSSTDTMLTDVMSSSLRGGGHLLPECVVNHDTPRSTRLPNGGGDQARRINNHPRVRGTLEIIQRALDLLTSALEDSLHNVSDPCPHHVGNHDRLQ